MCCFSGTVEDVAATRIFARMAGATRQLIAYEMELRATEPIAMILAVPTPPASPADSVRFIALDGYPRLFEDLYRATMYGSLGPGHEPALAVQVVGDYVASFVPTLADFARLDPRFRIPPNTVELVPGYHDFGFVVFQLRATRHRSRVHPMAFDFPTRDPRRLFFPLLHVHDGALHAEATFDHILFAQGIGRARLGDSRQRFGHNDFTLGQTKTMSNPHAALVVDLDAGISHAELRGPWPNRDLWVDPWVDLPTQRRLDDWADDEITNS
jgi:hypothetical protein